MTLYFKSVQVTGKPVILITERVTLKFGGFLNGLFFQSSLLGFLFSKNS